MATASCSTGVWRRHQRRQTAQGEVDEPAVMAYIRLLGSAFGIPTVQAMRSYRGWVAWENGDAPASSILFGPPPKE